MKTHCLVCCAVFLFSFRLVLGIEESEKIEQVTYGSTIKLEHVPSGFRLHSHDVSYGTGSGQQSITAFPHAGDSNSLWIVKGAHEDFPKPAGEIIKCGDVIRLQHLNTNKNLHSHDHKAPMNRDREVSAYAVRHQGKWAFGDIADNWVVECVARKQTVWKRFEQIRLQHEDSSKYLVANKGLTYGDPIPNQLHVSCASRKNANAVWKTNEGFYLAPMK